MRPILPPGWKWDAAQPMRCFCVGDTRHIEYEDDWDSAARAAWKSWELHSGIAREQWEDHLTFQALRAANVERCNSGAFNHTLEEWPPIAYACALAGEVGEACNLIKKMYRGLESDDVATEEVEDELADAQCYLDLLAARLEINLQQAVISKFNRVSERVDSPTRL